MASDVIRATQAVMLILMCLHLSVAFAPIDFSSSLLNTSYSTRICKLDVTHPHHNIRRNANQVDDDSSAYEEDKSKKQYTVARAGGRRPRSQKQTDNNPKIALFRQWALPLLCMIAILRLLFGVMFGSTNSNPNVVYYSRSVYQSTTYNQDGNIETKRKESVQSNVPSLIEKYGNDGIDIDKELNNEIDTFLFGKW